MLSLGELPCLEYLDLRHNPVTKENMYRIRVFIGFDERASQVNNGLQFLNIDQHMCNSQKMLMAMCRHEVFPSVLFVSLSIDGDADNGGKEQ